MIDVGIQTHTNSLANASSPRRLKNALMLKGETSMGRHGKKYLVASNGAKKATPSPPFVNASRSPCEAVTTKK